MDHTNRRRGLQRMLFVLAAFGCTCASMSGALAAFSFSTAAHVAHPAPTF